MYNRTGSRVSDLPVRLHIGGVSYGIVTLSVSCGPSG
jgi:hypothetical protein